MAKIETNIQKVRKSILDEQGRFIVRTRKLARTLATEARDNVRANIKAKPGGVFPGYAITGALARKVVASEPTKKGNGWVATVRVLRTGKQKAYALIHEVGGKIQIKNPNQLRAMFAALRKAGMRAKSSTRKGKGYIRIKAKHYFRKGIEKTRKTFNLERYF